MAHGQNAEKLGRCGDEYWSRRSGIFTIPGRYSKRMASRRERRFGRRAAHVVKHEWWTREKDNGT